MKLDILAFGAHPDDVELSASGTLINHIKMGYKCGIVDLTNGELGTRGTAETRKEEAEASSKIIGIIARENLNLADGFFTNDGDHRLEVVKMIRKYQPSIVLCNAISDRHPDHGRGASLVSDAIFLSGLVKVVTQIGGVDQLPWRPQAVYHYIQDRFIKPDFVVDVSDVWEQRMESVKAFKTQFYQADSTEPDTAISSKEFLDFLKGRAMEYGRPAGFQFAEGFTVERYPGINDLTLLK
ncbi:MAG: bacillithiol biosynthesis deacetylase BshB1 [Bacteroidia bacterium]|nr:bacillithiol biosynthesis deacetylase BshB1 [Bacteroidota bacterium]MBK7572144.1 bacillithiol biosynthesis deacetylase BshB1 [Bacteroidota bacterium]MBP9790194.1 bacillithiol biosynthesis deacetylase BshB1 [Bacteroidia bacterium]MBP9922281.1 bacillithiol biosynthesis deacetylase BshB1 [Bacteroidia bacterium]HQW00102.1 bacillithiol biosynthesis deacetylase BshB1 [Bacteroidia bacterium]